jgi:NarL family two-component system response regulator YdfI
MTPARVLVVADRDVDAARIEAMLRRHADLRVLVGTPGALARLIDEHAPSAVIVVSTQARLAAILETIADVSHVPPVVLLAGDPHAAWTSAARRAGIRAVLDRDAPAEEISAALTAAAAGLFALHPDVFRASQPTTLDTLEDRLLTTRELEVLEMLAEGLSNQIIARRLHISTYTVKFHVASILGKLGAGSRTEAVTTGVRRGLISL